MDRTQELLSELRMDRGASPPEKSNVRMLSRQAWLIVGLAAAFIGTSIAAASLLGQERLLEVQTMQTSMASRTENTSVLDATGYVTARRIATVSANMTGRLKEVLIDEGQYVEAGQVLARLDPVDANAQQRLIAAQLAASRSQLGDIHVQLRQAESDVKRHLELAERQFIGRALLEQRVGHRDSLRAQAEVARHNIEVAASQAMIANNGLENTTIRAPFSGVVVAKAAQPGEIVSPLSAGGGFTRSGILTLVDMNSLEIEVNVSEAYIGRVQPQMPVAAVLNAFPETRIPAEVIAIIPAADRNKATVKVRIAFKRNEPRLVPDMGVKVSFLDANNSGANTSRLDGIRIATGAVVMREGTPVAFVINTDSKVERRNLKLGASAGGFTYVLKGLRAGETVVISPPTEMVVGQRVKLLAPTGRMH